MACVYTAVIKASLNSIILLIQLTGMLCVNNWKLLNFDKTMVKQENKRMVRYSATMQNKSFGSGYDEDWLDCTISNV